MKLECGLDADSIFYKLGESGLISFSDYIFLLVLLSSKYRGQNIRIVLSLLIQNLYNLQKIYKIRITLAGVILW